MSLLTQLADACNDGAPNVSGLLISLGQAVKDEGVVNRPAIKCIVGHVSYLLGESLGPSPEAIQDYEAWKEGQ